MMLVVSMPFQDNLVMVYIAGCIGATVLEYVTGVTMEALFKVRYWDYSKNKFNFQGHICLGSSLAWGGLTILMTEFIHKPIEHFGIVHSGQHPHSGDTCNPAVQKESKPCQTPSSIHAGRAIKETA